MADSHKKLIMIIILCMLAIILGLVYIFSPPPTESKRIGVLLYQKTPTTLRFLDGLKSSLEKQGYYQGKNLSLFIENVGIEKQSVAAIIKKLGRQKIDLFIVTNNDLTITAARTIDKPIIFALVSNPVRDEIKDLIDSEKKITGISYFTPYDRTVELSKRIIPRLKKMTVLLPKKNKWSDLDKLKSAADDAKIELSEKVIELDQITKTIFDLRGKSDAIYLPNELQLVMQRDLIQKAIYQARIPAVSNNLGFQYSSVLTYFAEPETIGQIAGQMVIKIFHGANIAYMPVELSSHFKLVINLNLLQHLNLTINKDVLKYANEVIQ